MVKRSVALLFLSIIMIVGVFVAYSIIPNPDSQPFEATDTPQNNSELIERPPRSEAQPPNVIDIPQNENQTGSINEPVDRPEVKIPSPLEVVKFGARQYYANATGRTYYFDALLGDDGNDGLSEGVPLRSIAKLNSMTFNPGDHVYFKRGQIWSGTKLEVPSSGSEKNPIVFGAYGEGEFPIITVEGTDLDTAFLIAGRDYVTVRQVDVRGGLMASLSVYGSSYALIEDCRIGKGSMSMGVWVSDKPWAPKRGSADYGTIRNCIIDSGYSKRNGTTEDGIHLRINASHWTIHNVYLSGWGHSMVSLWQQGGNGSVSYNKVFDSYFTSGNITYTRAFDIKGHDGGAQFNEFYGNWIVNTSVRSQIGGDHNIIRGNIFHTIKNSPDKDYGTAQGIYLTNGAMNSSYVSHDNIIANNTFIDCDEPALFVRSIESYWPTYGNIIKNNTIYNCGRNSKEGYSNIGLFIANQTGVRNNSYLQNIFLYPAESKPILYADIQLSVQDFNEADKNSDVIVGNTRNNQRDLDIAFRVDTTPTPSWVPEGNRRAPWLGALYFATSSDGVHFEGKELFIHRAGVPNLLLTSDNTLIAVFQYFSYKYADMYDVIAYTYSKDLGKTWQPVRRLEVPGTCNIPRYKCNDPSLVETEDGKLRLYFSHNEPGVDQSMFSAVTSDIDEPFVNEGQRLVALDFADPAVVYFNGEWHHYSIKEAISKDRYVNVHSTSKDGLSFERQDNFEAEMAFLGHTVVDGDTLYFHNGGFVSSSKDGYSWKYLGKTGIEGAADPGVVKMPDGSF